jgi:N-acetylmuramoyl-L-alanine amidase
MIVKGFLLGLAAALLGLGRLSASAAGELRALDLIADANGAQLTLDLTDDGAVAQFFTLENPDRAVVDLPDTQLASGARVPAASGVVTDLRLGNQPGGTLRVVLELKSALPARTAWSADGRQLVLSVGAPGAATGAASATPAAPQTPSAVRAAHAPVEGDRDVVIAVDAGHGGDDPGAIGHGGTREKDVTLAIARALAERINAQPGMRAVLTRDRDEFLELRDRIDRAHAAHADMFISVHADSIADRSISGASVYVLSVHGASSEAAHWLAERENAADLVAGTRRDDQGMLEPLLIDAAQSQIIGVSASAAERVVSALEGVGEVRKAQVQRAGFVVLKSRNIPSMLIETAYISNRADEHRLRSAREQTRLAEAITSGVRSYFLQNPPDGTRFKQERRSTLASAAASSAAAR